MDHYSDEGGSTLHLERSHTSTVTRRHVPEDTNLCSYLREDKLFHLLKV
jgi:hypothetical protein